MLVELGKLGTKYLTSSPLPSLNCSWICRTRFLGKGLVHLGKDFKITLQLYACLAICTRTSTAAAPSRRSWPCQLGKNSPYSCQETLSGTSGSWWNWCRWSAGDPASGRCTRSTCVRRGWDWPRDSSRISAVSRGTHICRHRKVRLGLGSGSKWVNSFFVLDLSYCTWRKRKSSHCLISWRGLDAGQKSLSREKSH